MKAKQIAIVVVAVVAVGIAVTLLLRKPDLRVGVLLPFTGPHAAIGLGMRNAVRMAVDEVNARGGIQGRQVHLEELDDASSGEVAVAAARKLVADKTVVGAIDHYDIDCSIVTQPVFNDGGLGNVVAGVSTRYTVETLDTDFRIIAGMQPRMEVMAKYVWDTLGAHTFMYLTDKSVFGSETLNGFRAAVSPYLNAIASGYDVVGQDDEKLIAKIKEQNPQYLFYAGDDAPGGAFLKKLRDAGVATPFQAGIHFPSQEFIDAAHGAAEGALLVWHGVPVEDFPKGRAFTQAYAAKKYAEPAGPYGVFAYAGAQALLQAMEKSFLTRKSVVGALGHEQFDTALGPIRFFYLGSTYNLAVIYKVVSGKWTPMLISRKPNAPLEPYKPQ